MPEPERFPPEVVTRLGTYVYRLLDPRNGETFYVGKGKGNRVFAHIRAEAGLQGDELDNKLHRIREIRNQIARIAKPDSLETARQKAASPVVVEEQLPAGFPLVARRHHDERRQVVGLASQAVAEPGPHTGPPGNLRPGHEERDAGSVIDRLGVQAADDADIVGQRPDIGEHLAQDCAALAVLFVRLDRRDTGPLAVARRHRREPRGAADRIGNVLPRHFTQ